MLLKAITNGSVTSTGTVTCESGIVGGVLVTTDNTNQGTVILRRDTSGGKQIIEIKSVTSMWIAGPFSMEETDQLYYSVTGTGCEAQLYEWIT
ncbi:MAG: hypothetical protein GY809_09105 [Planctomycetes bacterium]|nr:hypothetical protein [Planctomycetota bacterium]